MFVRAVVNETICPNERKNFNISNFLSKNGWGTIIYPVLVHSSLRTRIIFSHSSNIYIHDINNDEGKWEKKNNFTLCIYKSKTMYFRHNQKRNLVSLNTFVVVNLWNVAVRVAFRPTIRQDPRPFLTATFVHQIALSSRLSEATFKRRLKKSEQRRGRRRRRTLSMRAHRCVNGRYIQNS